MDIWCGHAILRFREFLLPTRSICVIELVLAHTIPVEMRFMALNGLLGSFLPALFLCDLQSPQHPEVVGQNAQAHVDMTIVKALLFHR